MATTYGNNLAALVPEWLNGELKRRPTKGISQMWTLSGFADEIDPDFSTQCKVASELGLRFLEIRSAWGVNILDLDDSQLEAVQQLLVEYGLQVSSIGSPIGKIFIDDDFEPHLVRMRHAAEIAQRLGAPYVRLFSFFIRAGDNPDDHRDEVLRRMRALADIAEEAGVIAVHENEKDIYGDLPCRCLDIVTSVGSPNLKLAWDPANFVQVGVRPFTDGYADLRPHVAYIQIKDALLSDASVVVAGAGDGEVRETVRALGADGFDGFFSLDPHLGEFTAFGALSGPELFTKAWDAFTGILRSEGIQYS
jgi:sugar phosphate isomerase/epimerase